MELSQGIRAILDAENAETRAMTVRTVSEAMERVAHGSRSYADAVDKQRAAAYDAYKHVA